MKHRVDYDQIAPGYDRRFERRQPETGVGRSLRRTARAVAAQQVLEVGCGTGHWLAGLAADSRSLNGLDLSAGMLRQAHQREARLQLARGDAGRLPYAAEAFDLLYCVNAIHHFDDPGQFIAESFRVLRPGGRLCIIGSDHFRCRESWYIYQYFDSAFETDQRRFPGWDGLQELADRAGFIQIEKRDIEHIQDPKHGRQVLCDPFLAKGSCSQLALLTDEEYQAGLTRIREDLDRAEARGEVLRFTSDIALAMLSGRKP